MTPAASKPQIGTSVKGSWSLSGKSGQITYSFDGGANKLSLDVDGQVGSSGMDLTQYINNDVDKYMSLDVQEPIIYFQNAYPARVTVTMDFNVDSVVSLSPQRDKNGNIQSTSGLARASLFMTKAKSEVSYNPNDPQATPSQSSKTSLQHQFQQVVSTGLLNTWGLINSPPYGAKPYYTDSNGNDYWYYMEVPKLIQNYLDKHRELKTDPPGEGSLNWPSEFVSLQYVAHPGATSSAHAKGHVEIAVEPSQSAMVEDIPDIMKNVGMPIGAAAMRTWMSLPNHPANGGQDGTWDRSLPVAGVDIATGEAWTSQITMSWLLSDAANKDVTTTGIGQSIKDAYKKILSREKIVSIAHYNALSKTYAAKVSFLKLGQVFTFGPTVNDLKNFRKNFRNFHSAFQTQYAASENIDDVAPISALGKSHVLTEATAVIGKVSFYLAPYGHMQLGKNGYIVWTIEGAYVYYIDSYDFNDKRPLGVWKKPNLLGRLEADPSSWDKGAVIEQHNGDANNYSLAGQHLYSKSMPHDSFENYRYRHQNDNKRKGSGGDFLMVPPQPRHELFAKPIKFTVESGKIKALAYNQHQNIAAALTYG